MFRFRVRFIFSVRLRINIMFRGNIKVKVEYG